MTAEPAVIAIPDIRLGDRLAILADISLGDGGFEIMAIRGEALELGPDWVRIGDANESSIVMHREAIEVRRFAA